MPFCEAFFVWAADWQYPTSSNQPCSCSTTLTAHACHLNLLLLAEAEAQQAEIARLEEFVARFGAKASKVQDRSSTSIFHTAECQAEYLDELDLMRIIQEALEGLWIQFLTYGTYSRSLNGMHCMQQWVS